MVSNLLKSISQNRLVSCVKGATTSNFLYGADGLRRQTSVTTGGTTTTRKNVLDNGMMVRELDSAGVAKTTYLQGASGAVYRREDFTNGGQSVKWYVYDGLGSVACELNPNGTVAGRRVVDAYGMTRTTSGSGGKHGFVGSLGHTTDETGLVYMRARHYDPTTGRFQSQDKAQDGENWFAYCNGDPVNYVDESGNELQVPQPPGNKFASAISSGANAALISLIAGFCYCLGMALTGNSGIWNSVFSSATIHLAAIGFLIGFIGSLLKLNAIDCGDGLKGSAKAAGITGGVAFAYGLVQGILSNLSFQAGMVLFHVFLVDHPEA